MPTIYTLKVLNIKPESSKDQVSKETIHIWSPKWIASACKSDSFGQRDQGAITGGYIRCGQTILAFHATLHFSISYHNQHSTFQLKIYMRYFRQLLRGFVLPIPLFRVVSPGGRVGRGFRSFASIEKRNYLLRLQNLRTCICLHLCTLES